ncbi:MAG: glutamine amidotransferase, partial [Mesorhizobium sp.]
MCGIVGLFLKDKTLEPKLGAMLSEMLISLSDRGPDSAGIAIYGAATGNEAKITVQSPKPERDFRGLDVAVKSTHAVIRTTPDKVDAAREALQSLRPDIRIMGAGEAVEIYKEVGLPEAVVDRFDVRSMTGTHGIGHT